MNISFKFENYNKKTPPHWKAIGDTALYSIPIIDSLIVLIPEIPAKVWIVVGWTFIAAVVKIITKYITEVEKEKEVPSVDTN